MKRMFDTRRAAAIAVLCAVSPQPAVAAASAWEDVEGARLRLIVEPAPAGQAEMRGLLQIELEQGWKTYWREPGSAGIPPQISVVDEAISAVEIHYPAPEWTVDAYGAWVGYKHPVSLPLTFTLAGDTPPATVATDVFLGICHDVCVPVAVRFEVAPDDRRGRSMQTLLLDAAFSALPGDNSERLAVESAAWTPDGRIEIRLLHAAAQGEAQLFLSAGASQPFRKPVLISGDDGSTVFRAEPAFDPASAGELTLTVTARHGIDAAEVTLTVPAP